jgi:protease-4
MENIPIPKPPQQVQIPKEGFLGKTARRIKSIATIFGSFVKILFNIGLALFIVLFIIGLLADNQGETAQSHVLYGKGNDRIAIVNLNGTILDIVPSNPLDVVSDTDNITPRKVLLVLERIKEDPTIKAVILKINSPGGSVTASDEIYETIMRFKKETNIPVFASLSEIAASGGYYIALSADTITANPTTLTGSIGVIANTYNFKELADKYGVKEISINSGNNKNFLSPFEEPSEEQRTILKGIVDEAYQQFLSKVRSSRPTPDSILLPIADGRPISGEQAVTYQLIDSVGSFHDTVSEVRSKINSPDAQVVEYGLGGLFQNILQGVSKPFIRSELKPLVILQQFSNKPVYLYSPL